MEYDIQKIMEILPHRYPLLLVDRILNIEPGKKVVAIKNVTINEPHFEGHFPGAPIMPGVLIIEAMAQAGGILAFESSFQEKSGLIYFMGIDNVKFRKPVVPGDQLISEVEILKLKTKVVKMRALATVDGNRVAEADFMATLGEKK